MDTVVTVAFLFFGVWLWIRTDPLTALRSPFPQTRHPTTVPFLGAVPYLNRYPHAVAAVTTDRGCWGGDRSAVACLTGLDQGHANNMCRRVIYDVMMSSMMS